MTFDKHLTHQTVSQPPVIYDALVAALTQFLTPEPTGHHRLLLPPGQTLEIAVPPGTNQARVDALPSGQSYLFMALLFGIQTIATVGEIAGIAKSEAEDLRPDMEDRSLHLVRDRSARNRQDRQRPWCG